MNHSASVALSIVIILFSPQLDAFAQAQLAGKETAPKTLNTPRTFPQVESRREWRSLADDIREQILVSCGLWPMPERPPVQPHIFGKIERDGYSVEKVYFETYPGFFLAGNLYRPLNRGNGPFPGVLNPHGHWANGRLVDGKDGSVIARCINFARQGMVAFCYDMVGFNDSRFADLPWERSFNEVHRYFGTNRTDQLWNISLMGIQTWNTLRALDFLEALPDVDKKRLACTGASGGGTQTYILGAIDDRLAAQAPIVMVSHTMQGGCNCENAPGLRIDFSNMEIAAAAAPRPQILVAATGDWTKATMEVEGPAIARVYELFGRTDRLRYVRFDFGHNYNQTSREAVYDWFGRWLLHQTDSAALKETAYQSEPEKDLRVFPDKNLPAGVLTMKQFNEQLKRIHQQRWNAWLPRDRKSFREFEKMFRPAWEHTLQVSLDDSKKDLSGTALTELELTLPKTDGKGTIVIVVSDEKGVSKPLSKIGENIFVTHLALQTAESESKRDEFSNFFTTYNRTLLQEQVGRLVAACEAARQILKTKRVILVGEGRAGIWALLAAPAADAVVADCNELDVSNDENLLEPGLFCPGIRNIGTFEGAAMLAAPNPLLLHNAGQKFSTSGIQSAFKALKADKKLRIEPTKLDQSDWRKWLEEL